MRQTFYEFCMLHERTSLLKEWDESRNFPLTPDTVSYGSKKKVWWTCENGHSWQTTVHVRSEGSGCPYCTGRKVLPGFNDLETLYPDVAAQWDREKNGSLSPRDVSTGSKIRIWWRCPEGHSWQSPVAQRRADTGDGHTRQQQKGLVAVLHGTRVEIRHLSAHRRAAVRLPRLRRKGEHNTRAALRPARRNSHLYRAVTRPIL